jgi:membrane protein DedA with SNARE-associated domain
MVEYILDVCARLGYGGILFFMFLESTIFPVPSEIVMIPAGVLAAQGRMDPWIAIAMGIIGSLAGALTNYYGSLWVGRPFLERYGRYFFLPRHRLEQVERFFNRHGEISTFTGRLIPVIRHLISIPAGLSRMNLFHFTLYTCLGAGIWVSILVWIGYVAGKQLEKIDSDAIMNLWRRYSTEVTVGLILFCALIIAAYVFFYRRKRRARA